MRQVVMGVSRLVGIGTLLPADIAARVIGAGPARRDIAVSARIRSIDPATPVSGRQQEKVTSYGPARILRLHAAMARRGIRSVGAGRSYALDRVTSLLDQVSEGNLWISQEKMQ